MFDFNAREKPPSSMDLATAYKPYIETSIEAFGGGSRHVPEQLPARRSQFELSDSVECVQTLGGSILGIRECSFVQRYGEARLSPGLIVSVGDALMAATKTAKKPVSSALIGLDSPAIVSLTSRDGSEWSWNPISCFNAPTLNRWRATSASRNSSALSDAPPELQKRDGVLQPDNMLALSGSPADLSQGRMVVAVGEIHVWSASIDVEAATIDRCYAILSDDERERAARFHFDRHRRRYIASHCFLRTVLAAYRGERAELLSFQFGKQGKPSISSGPEFSFSHAGSLAVVAMGGSLTVGVDIEPIRQIDDLELIAARYFHPSEYQSLMDLPSISQTRAFFLCWTRKEAFVKATGEGLSADLASFEVNCTPDVMPSLKTRSGCGGESDGIWSIHHIEPAPGYVGAVIAGGSPTRLREMHLSLSTTFAA